MQDLPILEWTSSLPPSHGLVTPVYCARTVIRTLYSTAKPMSQEHLRNCESSFDAPAVTDDGLAGRVHREPEIVSHCSAIKGIFTEK